MLGSATTRSSLQSLGLGVRYRLLTVATCLGAVALGGCMADAATDADVGDDSVGVNTEYIIDMSTALPTRATTVYEGFTTGNNNGPEFCIGNLGSSYRRALVEWAMPSIPSGSTVTRVEVTFNQYRVRGLTASPGDRSSGGQLSATLRLRRLEADWTTGGGPDSTPCGPPDTGSGVVVNTVPATTSTRGTATMTNAENFDVVVDSNDSGNSGLVADAQRWLDNSSNNHGWFVTVTEESTDNNARWVRPRALKIYYTVAVGQTCDDDNDCTNNQCVRTSDGADCPGSGTCLCCDASTCSGICQDDCSGGTCDAASSGTVCRPASCTGETRTVQATCGGATTCPALSQVSCSPFACSAGSTCETTCSDDSDCASAAFCNTSSSLCELKRTTGLACSGTNWCSSNFCTDGVCCTAACGGQCQACDVSSFVGTCTNVTGVPHGSRTACASDGGVCGGTCNGSMSGSCAFPGGGTSCRDASCTGGMAGTETLAAVCQGNGSCGALVTNACTPFACDTAACFTMCATVADCATDYFCNSSFLCESNRPLGGACTSDGQCASGSCADGVCCDAACGGQCEACNAAGACGPVTGAPVGTRSACTDDGMGCGGACDGSLVSACIYPGASTSCRAASCTSGTETIADVCQGDGNCGALVENACTPYTCGATACYTSCTTDFFCASTAWCNAGSECEPKFVNGQACSANNECSSRNCVDGVCCFTRCLGQCEACDVPGSVGVCSPVTGAPQGLRTACADDGLGCGGDCDGITGSVCTYPGSATGCRSASCTAGTETPAAGCAGDGSCAAVTTNMCSPYACSGDACATTCADDTDCGSGAFCNSSSVCELTLSNGTACMRDEGCTSGNCVDGVCCDLFCTGQCEACNVAGRAGICSAVTGAPAGIRAACTDDGTGCGGTCDGTLRATCTYPDGSSSCRSASCASGTETIAASCAGDGNCGTLVENVCSPFLCSGTACGTMCAGDSDCIGAAFCNSASMCEGTRIDGAACTTGGQCISSSCADGVCCDVACSGQCEACDLTPGVCSPVTGPPRGARAACTDDGTGCGGTCSGTFTPSCEYPRAAVRCRTAGCTAGTETMAAGCAGDGTCEPLVETMCSPYTCFGSACGSSCTGASDCISGAVCAGGICVGALPDGDACTLDGACASGSCTDGFCCDTACLGRCEACGEAGSEGTCVAVTGDPRGIRVACPSDGSFCGGTCDGTLRDDCTYADSTTSCRAASCTDGESTPAADCVGTGNCPVARFDTCASGMCDGDVCADAPPDAGFDGGLDAGVDGAVDPLDGGIVMDTGPAADAGEDPMDAGCACRAGTASDASHSAVWSLLFVLAFVFRRRRSKRR